MRKLLLLFPLLLIACHRDPRPLLNGRVEAYLTDLGPGRADGSWNSACMRASG